MRSRGGVFSLITYVLYTLFGIITTLLFVSNADILQVPGFNILFLIFGFSAITIAACGIILLVLKALHMATRFVLFGIPCLLADGYIIWHVVSTIISIGAITGEMLVLLPLLFLSVGSFISNVRSF